MPLACLYYSRRRWGWGNVDMITAKKMKAAGFSPIIHGKYIDQGWTMTLLNECDVVVELYYTAKNGWRLEVTTCDEYSEKKHTIPFANLIMPLINEELLPTMFSDKIELPHNKNAASV